MIYTFGSFIYFCAPWIVAILLGLFGGSFIFSIYKFKEEAGLNILDEVINYVFGYAAILVCVIFPPSFATSQSPCPDTIGELVHLQQGVPGQILLILVMGLVLLSLLQVYKAFDKLHKNDNINYSIKNKIPRTIICILIYIIYCYLIYLLFKSIYMVYGQYFDFSHKEYINSYSTWFALLGIVVGLSLYLYLYYKHKKENDSENQ